MEGAELGCSIGSGEPPDQQDQWSVESVGSNGEETRERRGKRGYREGWQLAAHTGLTTVTVGRGREMCDAFAVEMCCDGTFHATTIAYCPSARPLLSSMVYK